MKTSRELSDEVLLRALGEAAWCSGAGLAARLGVTRAAVWKGIERLRRRGYEVAGEAGRGYRLVRETTLLRPEQLRSRVKGLRLGTDWVHRDVVDSTNRLATELARGGAPEGLCVVAEAQTAGRGRLGRTWSSPPNLNLYLSIVLRPALAPHEVPQLTLVAAVAAAEAIEGSLDARPEIKWPNDILLGGRKAVGILTELEAEADRARFVILGIGVNVNAGEADFPPELRRKATSLAIAAGRRIDRLAFTAALVLALDRAYDEFLREGFSHGLRRRYQSYHTLAGKEVQVEGSRRLVGVVRDIAADGALLLATAQGEERVVAGEVTLTRSYRGLRGAASARLASRAGRA